MNLAISNIAWERDEEAAAAEIMATLGISRVEIAPTKVWDVPLEATDAQIKAYRRWWERQGIQIVALQSLNYGHPEFQIFGDATLRDQFLAYLKGIISLGAKLGAKVLVFGSPKNRLVGELPASQAHAIAVEFFGDLGQTAADHGVVFCIEPNPPAYGCDFVTNTHTGIGLVQAVSSPGFGLHLDAAGLTLAGGDPAGAIREAMPSLRHFHLSEPFLEEIGPGQVDHENISKTLRETSYSQVVSIEMKAGPAGSNVDRVRRALEFAQKIY